ncbi:MAG: GmrSD restriction endonuclease domain-containing protein [Gemmatimonas sp.]
MAGSSFQTNPVDLLKLLERCHDGDLQLPDFQRSWVWDEERIKSLIASVSRGFPVGALMALETGGEVNFKPRAVEGAPSSAQAAKPSALLLDGQQRMTSLYQVSIRRQVVETVTPKHKKVKRWFYLDIRKAIDDSVVREEAVLGVPEDKVLRTDFGRETLLDLSEPTGEFKELMFPVSEVFDWDSWQDGFDSHWPPETREENRAIFRLFKRKVLENFKSYRVPVITLDKDTTKEAVCVVFEKVNTGGKSLDAFELVTATYASSGHELRKDWYGDSTNVGRHGRLSRTLRSPGIETGILSEVANTDFLQAISLFHTRERRMAAEAAGKSGRDLPAVSANRQALLNLPLDAYKKYEAVVEEGFVRAAKFLYAQRIFRVLDLPYQSQVVPLAAILADLGEDWRHDTLRAKVAQWYWNGVFGELYGSAVETRIARDFMEVPSWLRGGAEPSTVSETQFRPNRLKTMRMRLSAAYKGVNALLMKEGAIDFKSGQPFSDTIFFAENVDIHHIFPQDWCKKRNIPSTVYDSIINKTPLSYQTNRAIGGVAPSEYIARLENGSASTFAISASDLDQHIRSHAIEPKLLRSDSFDAFMLDRQERLLRMIENATGKSRLISSAPDEGISVELDGDAAEAALTIL